MSGRRPWSEIKKKASPKTIRRAEKSAEKILASPLYALRKARHLSQQALAEMLDTTQPEISKIEHRTDVFVSTLRRYIAAMGGRLDLVAHFPSGTVTIDQFASDVETGEEALGREVVRFSPLLGKQKRVAKPSKGARRSRKR